MATAAKLTPVAKSEAPVGLALLREPFPAHQISKLPKPYKKDSPRGKCNECGGYHGLPAVHLDYVGHAALTDRLLDTDPHWSWEPVAFDERGLPARDQNGGLWIKLTVCGVTRLGYGSADGKSGGDAVKELIGDALRNAAMRFGAALDLWHKGDLHAEPEAEADEGEELIDDGQYAALQQLIEASGASVAAFLDWLGVKRLADIPASRFAEAEEALKKRVRKNGKAAPTQRREPAILDDEIPY